MALVLVLASALLALLFWDEPEEKKEPLRTDRRAADSTLVLVTGYCNCEHCCSWKRSWFGLGEPVYASGPLRGKPKKVGVTASGVRARHGTIAADTRLWPFGTRLVVPGYGTGTVHDVGGAIKGRHIDVWFPNHEAARKWGSRYLKVRVLDP